MDRQAKLAWIGRKRPISEHRTLWRVAVGLRRAGELQDGLRFEKRMNGLYVEYRVASAAPKETEVRPCRAQRCRGRNRALELENGSARGRQGSPYRLAYRRSGQDQRRLHRNRPREAPVGQGRRSLHVAREPERLHLGPRRPIGSDFWGSRRTRNASFRMRADASARKYRKGTISSDLPRHLTRDSASSRRLRRVSKHAAFGCPEDGNYRPGGALSAKN